MKISIPNPCHVPLESMQPTAEGFHCSSCAHTVTDFRDWSAAQIQTYFKNHTGKVCGILKANPTQELEPIVITPKYDYSKLSFNQRFIYAFFLCFGTWLFSCGDAKHTTVSDKSLKKEVTVIDNSTLTKPPTDTLIGHYKGNFQIGVQLQEKDSSSAKTVSKHTSILPETAVDIEDDILKPIEMGNVSITKKEENEALVFGTIEIYAQFPGGQDSLKRFIQRNLVYPEFEREREIEGTVYVQFTVDEEGNVINPTIMRGVNGSINFNEEVIRIIALMPKWKPGSMAGKPIKTRYNLPIKFEL